MFLKGVSWTSRDENVWNEKYAVVIKSQLGTEEEKIKELENFFLNEENCKLQDNYEQSNVNVTGVSERGKGDKNNIWRMAENSQIW